MKNNQNQSKETNVDDLGTCTQSVEAPHQAPSCPRAVGDREKQVSVASHTEMPAGSAGAHTDGRVTRERSLGTECRLSWAVLRAHRPDARAHAGPKQPLGGFFA